MVKVSICIPAYNNVAGIKRLLESILKQTFRDYEIIITDDSEDDRIYQLVRGQNGIQYYKNQKRLGSTANWNEAMSRCSGEYIKIMHHDDWFTSDDSLQSFVSLLDEHPDADMVFCGTRQAESNRSFDRFIEKEDAKMIAEDYRNLYLGNTIGAPSAVMHRRNVGTYDERLVWLVDMEFYMSILKKNPNFYYTEQPLISIGVSDTQLTEACIQDKKINISEYGYIYQKYELGEYEKYREKLIQILIKNDAGYAEALQFGVSAGEYKKRRVEKLVGKIKWKLGIRE